LQSFLAAVALFIVVLVLGKGKVVVIGAMGATSFIVFAMPLLPKTLLKRYDIDYLLGLDACS